MLQDRPGTDGMIDANKEGGRDEAYGAWRIMMECVVLSKAARTMMMKLTSWVLETVEWECRREPLACAVADGWGADIGEGIVAARGPAVVPWFPLMP